MKHETQMSNHLTITQLLCEQISIISILSKWILKQLNSPDNSAPQQGVEKSTNETMRERRKETSMLAKSVGEPQRHWITQRKHSKRSTFLFHIISNRNLLSKQKGKLYPLLLGGKNCSRRDEPHCQQVFYNNSIYPRISCHLYFFPKLLHQSSV